MKTLRILQYAILFTVFTAGTISCQDEEKDAEAKERDKVGKVYDHEQQGIDIENRDNQFPSSRNNNSEGEGLETGAPSDTIDGDGDKAKVAAPVQAAPTPQTPQK